LDLFDLAPDFFTDLPLNLPRNERENALPDLLDEAHWNLDFYRRMQTGDGGIRGGVESTSHPRPGETSWQESLLVGVFQADARSSFDYAAVAAKFAYLVAPFSEELSQRFKDSALAAFAYGEAHYASDIQSRYDSIDHESLRGTSGKKLEGQIAEFRNLAALELYRLTGEAHYHETFLATSLWEQGIKGAQQQRNAFFSYAVMEGENARPDVQSAMREAILELADIALEFQSGNRFGIATDAPNLPIIGYVGYFSVPGMISASLPRAYYLSGDPRYLRGALTAANFSAGANPDNMVYTTGVGVNYPQNPLHIDSRMSGQAAPTGITVYGPSDPAESLGYNDWMHTWFLQDMVPDSRAWPAAESYLDVYEWPAMCEYTVHQTLGPTSYFWGLLAARKTSSK
jgi:endoglucanase